MKFQIFYHGNCDDGFGAYWACQHWIKKVYSDSEIIGIEAKYGEMFAYDLPSVNTKGHILFILDFSLEPQQMINLTKDFEKVIWIDHHESAIKAWDTWVNQQENAEFSIPANFIDVLSRDNTSSGATLTWEFMSGDADGQQLASPAFLNYIEDYDLWKFNYPETKPFKAGMGTQKRDLKTFDLYFYNPAFVADVISAGSTILEYRNELISNILKQGKIITYINGVMGLGCNCNYAFASEIGNILAKESGSYGLTWYGNNKAETIFSIRSIGDYDVSVIAKKFDGGGHKNAAGFTIYQPVRGAEAVYLFSADSPEAVQEAENKMQWLDLPNATSENEMSKSKPE